MEYILSKKYDTPELQALIMGPNPVKLEEELLHGSRIAPGAVVCDLGSGTGLTSVFMAKEYGFTGITCPSLSPIRLKNLRFSSGSLQRSAA